MTAEHLPPETRVYLERWSHKCPVCGREFFARTAHYAYVRRTRKEVISEYYCSWSCLRKAEADGKKKKKEG